MSGPLSRFAGAGWGEGARFSFRRDAGMVQAGNSLSKSNSTHSAASLSRSNAVSSALCRFSLISHNRQAHPNANERCSTNSYSLPFNNFN